MTNKALFESQTPQEDTGVLSTAQKLRVVGTILIPVCLVCGLSVVGRVLFTEKITFAQGAFSKNDAMVAVVLPMVIMILLGGWAIIALRRPSRPGSIDIVWARRGKGEVAWSCALLAAGLVVSIGGHLLLRAIDVDPIEVVWVPGMKSRTFLFARMARIALLTPFVEELFWRGYFQDRFGKVIGPSLAVIGQAIVFAAMHFGYATWMVVVFAHGLVWGAWRLKRKTLVPLIATHAAVNLLFCAYLWSAHSESRKARITVDYVAQFRELSKPNGYDPNLDGREYYERAFALVVECPEEFTTGDLKVWPGRLPHEKQEMLADWVRANDKALDQLQRGTTLPYYQPKYSRDSIMDPQADLLKVRPLARVAWMRAQLRANEGKLTEALDELAMCYRFAQRFAGCRTLVEQLVGIAVRAGTTETCLRILSETSVDSALLKNVQATFEELLTRDKAVDFTETRLTYYDCIQRTFTDDGAGDGRMLWTEAAFLYRQLRASDPDLTKEQFGRLLGHGRRKTMELADKMVDLMDAVVDKSPAHWHKIGKNPDEMVMELAWDSYVLMMVTHNVGLLNEVNWRAKVQTQALTTVLALFRCKADTQELPERLAELVSAGYLKTLPIDPYTDKTLVYRRTGESFVLYSFGADHDDDGGKPSKWGKGEDGGDQVFWPAQFPTATEDAKDLGHE
ncbi:MAG: lysostaphin resistance A-like protein [Planctomycetota bacterium]